MATVLKNLSSYASYIFFIKNKFKSYKAVIFSDVTFHDQNGYSEEKSPVTYHLKTNFLLRNIFPINLHLFIKFCLFCIQEKDSRNFGHLTVFTTVNNLRP